MKQMDNMSKKYKYITKTALLGREGWNLQKLEYWFPAPDKTKRNFHIPSSRIDHPLCMKLYDRKKVAVIEKGSLEDDKEGLGEEN